MDIFKRILFLGLVGVVAVVWYAVFHFENRQNLVITFFDVGQGDAIFIEVPGGNQILIDGGPNAAILSKLGQTMPFWDRSIDLIVLTHPHADHLDGLLEVLERYKVDMVLESGAEHSIPEYYEWRQILEKRKVPVVVARAGQKIKAGDLVLDILMPLKEYAGLSPRNVHEAMIVSRAIYGKDSFLFTGDAEKSLEFLLLSTYGDKLDSDLLKVGHHGSKTSTSKEFLAAVSPPMGIIQSGRKNRYGHPHQDVLDRLASVGVNVLRNDLNGDIQLKSDGDSFIIR